MSWKLLDRPKTVKVTKKLATSFAEMDAPPHDRPLSERRMMVYQRLLAEGGFRPVTWATVLCKETSGVYRVNGKHTSTMLSGLDQIPDFYAVIEEYECDTLEDVARLYSTFDSKTQLRSSNDIYLSFAATMPELNGIASRTITVAVAGIDLYISGGSQSGKGSKSSSAADRAERLFDNGDFVIWLDSILSGGESVKREVNRKGSRHLQRASVVGCMFGTWQKAKKESTDFWTGVRDESGVVANLADRKLARYLLTVSVLVGNGSGHTKVASQREVYVKCVHAWNAWRKKENTELKYYADKDTPAIR